MTNGDIVEACGRCVWSSILAQYTSHEDVASSWGES